jgi:hypothetical protein
MAPLEVVWGLAQVLALAAPPRAASPAPSPVAPLPALCTSSHAYLGEHVAGARVDAKEGLRHCEGK